MKRKRVLVRDGLAMSKGSVVRRWFNRNQSRLEGHANPAPMKHRSGRPTHTTLTLVQRIVAAAHWGVENRGHFIYSEASDRSEMFNLRPFDLAGKIHADCSQFVASILDWLGVKGLTDTDYTGTLLQKGKLLLKPQPGCVAIWGPHTGRHTAFITEPAPNGDWWTIGFGHQGAPDRVLLSQMNAYFNSVGQSGVRFLDFSS